MEIAEAPMAVAQVAELGNPVFADVGGEVADDYMPPDDPVLCVGPEGGFAPGEIPDDARRISLGPTILRVETAAIAGSVLLRSRS